ncbi:hypothetical protein [Photorhabdus sp. RM323S]|uniref:hypothetical protein n=1 Tax=Photorhabdus sp. RM323S TaxID=3342828 RepID=UPI0036DA368D
MGKLWGDISLEAADVEKVPSNSTAVVANKLATVRMIAGVSIDVTVNISILAGKLTRIQSPNLTISININSVRL